MSDDPELLRRYVDERSEPAFAELVRRHLDLVYFAAWRQLGGDSHRAEEVAQQVFTDLARKASALAHRPTLTGWLHTSTRFAAAKARRSDVAWRKHEQEAHTMHELLHHAGPPADWERLRPIIDAAIGELGERDREAVLLRFFEGRSFGRIGTALHVSEDGARMRVERALEKLRGELAQRGVSSTNAALALAFADQVGATAPAGLAASIVGAALSGTAGSGATTTAAAIGFMTATKTMLTLGAVAALTLATAFLESHQAHAAATALINPRQDLAAARRRLAELDDHAGTAEQTLAARGKDRGPADGAAGSSASPSAKLPTLQQFLNNNAELRALRAEANRAMVVANNSWVVNKGDWTPERLHERTENAVHDAQQLSARQAAGAEPKPPASEGNHAMAIVAYMSAAGYFADDPLTSEQAWRIGDIIESANTSPERRTERRFINWDRALPQLEPQLSAAQWKAMQGVAALGRMEAQLDAAAQETAPAP